jgi:hypothetical protein
MNERSATIFKVVLDEGRMLVLGVEVLIGFGYQATFQPGFDRLSGFARDVFFAAFLLLLGAFGLLLMIPAHHRLVEEGRDTPGFFRFATIALSVALVPFSAALAMELFVVSEGVVGRAIAFGASASILMAAALGWFLVPAIRSFLSPDKPKIPMTTKLPPLEERIDQVLTECRVVLPGTQALLGFQLIAFLTDGFRRLAPVEQITHLIGLIAILLSAILLMLPAAYHRIGERGKNTEHLFRMSNGCLLLALVSLALGISLDFSILARRCLDMPVDAAVTASIVFTFFVAIWFLIPLWRRHRQRR